MSWDPGGSGDNINMDWLYLLGIYYMPTKCRSIYKYSCLILTTTWRDQYHPHFIVRAKPSLRAWGYLFQVIPSSAASYSVFEPHLDSGVNSSYEFTPHIRDFEWLFTDKNSFIVILRILRFLKVSFIFQTFCW